MCRKQNVAYQVDASGIEYLDGLYSYALVLSRNHADADDLVYQTYVRAAQEMGRLSADGNTRSSFFTILRNIWISQLTKQPSGPQMFETELDDGFTSELVIPSKSSYDLHVSNMEPEQVRTAIQELPVDFREVIVLRECEELSLQEIASILGCSEETVKAQLARARSMLRIVLSARLEKFGSSWEGKAR
jgi:RNA polymerase sigma-70 factor (ECF subfamily)